MRIWFLSDTHAMEKHIKIPENIDIVIHAGDASNYREVHYNNEETQNFIEWYKNLNIPFKLFTPGNHDVLYERKLVNGGDLAKEGITYVEHATVNVLGLKIFMSPYTPAFGEGWVFNKKREKLHDYWQEIPEDCDIVITHGPPHGILDLSEDRQGRLEHCGCKALMKRLDIIKPLIYSSGHIHDCQLNRNAGVYINENTTFINGSCVRDGIFKIKSNGVVITLEEKIITKIEVL